MARTSRSTLDPWELAALVAGVCYCCSQPLAGRARALCTPCEEIAGHLDERRPGRLA